MAATGKHVNVQLIDIVRIGVDGRIAEQWGVFDMFALMHQLGVVGAPASRTAVEPEQVVQFRLLSPERRARACFAAQGPGPRAASRRPLLEGWSCR
jgi:SnoaL-like polyketide cyclase